MQLFQLFQLIIGAMSMVEKMKGASGEDKKAIVMQGVKTVLPIVAPMLPQDAQHVLGVVDDGIDALHSVLKKNNLYPQLDAVLVQTDVIIDSAFPQQQRSTD